jgi:hypothetical protein
MVQVSVELLTFLLYSFETPDYIPDFEAHISILAGFIHSLCKLNTVGAVYVTG